jgi:putative hydrolase
MTCSNAYDQLPLRSLEEVRRGEGRSLPLSNSKVADRLEEIAYLLEEQNADPFRVKAYRNTAGTLRNLDQRVCSLLSSDGLAGLKQLPGIGESLARTIEQLVFTDRSALLDRLRGGSGSVDVFATVPGIGPTLARRIHEDLGIESLAELEVASYDERLSQVHGMGRGRVRAVQDSLAGRFRRRPGMPESSRARADGSAPVSELLDIDRDYREKAQALELPLIAPRRFNPTGEAWLPVMHAHRGDRHYTALYSNTARAHDLGMTRDWVVIYRDDHAGRGQWTVVTARLGALSGKRIVSGRETECHQYYAEG